MMQVYPVVFPRQLKRLIRFRKKLIRLSTRQLKRKKRCVLSTGPLRKKSMSKMISLFVLLMTLSSCGTTPSAQIPIHIDQSLLQKSRPLKPLQGKVIQMQESDQARKSSQP